MNLYPAIDLYDGCVVRLTRGDYEKKKVYSDNPVRVAQEWEQQGAQWIHIVDLEGAKTGLLKNLPSLLAIRKNTTCQLEMGGGLRKIADLEMLIGEGIDRVVLGTKALDPDFLKQASAQFGSKVAVGLDIRNGMVQTQGWLESGGATLEAALQELNSYPVETIIYTDIQKDGMLEGPNFDKLQQVLALSNARIILSGGVSSLKDIERCKKIAAPNFEGMIVGRALYEKKFNVEQALKTMKTLS